MIDSRILVAEDDEDLRRVLREQFLERGAQVAEASSGLELTRMLCDGGPFDLVVSDVRMSWASGAQVLAMARLAGNETPFLIITGYRDEQLKASVEQLGAVLIYKPLALASLFEAAEGLLRSRTEPSLSARSPRGEASAATTQLQRST